MPVRIDEMSALASLKAAGVVNVKVRLKEQVTLPPAQVTLSSPKVTLRHEMVKNCVAFADGAAAKATVAAMCARLIEDACLTA